MAAKAMQKAHRDATVVNFLQRHQTMLTPLLYFYDLYLNMKDSRYANFKRSVVDMMIGAILAITVMVWVAPSPDAKTTPAVITQPTAAIQKTVTWEKLPLEQRQQIRGQVFATHPELFSERVEWAPIGQYLASRYDIHHDNASRLLRTSANSEWPSVYERALRDRHAIRKALRNDAAYNLWLEQIRPYVIEKLGQDKAEVYIGLMK